MLLTHANGDHVGFSERARASTGARVWVHSADEQAARTGKAPAGTDGSIARHLLRAQLYRTIWVLGRAGAGRIVPVAELSTFGDGATVDVPGRPRVLHVPGHTDGSAALLLEDRGILFTGDARRTNKPGSAWAAARIGASSRYRSSDPGNSPERHVVDLPNV